MPLYEYKCQKCGKHFEKIEKFSGPNMSKCPDCGGKVDRLISAPAIQFKGSGWYVTDYARGSSGAADKSDSGKTGSSDSASASKSESKDTKTEGKSASSGKKDLKKSKK